MAFCDQLREPSKQGQSSSTPIPVSSGPHTRQHFTTQHSSHPSASKLTPSYVFLEKSTLTQLFKTFSQVHYSTDKNKPLDNTPCQLNAVKANTPYLTINCFNMIQPHTSGSQNSLFTLRSVNIDGNEHCVLNSNTTVPALPVQIVVKVQHS
jgi:hypothetical protein